MTDGVMQYNGGHISQLTSELTSYHGQLGNHQDDANSAHGALLANWQGGATETFSAAHQKLMQHVQELRDTLHSGIQGVQSAYENATGADNKVAGSFS